jgi:hypothetical protein
MVPSFGIRRVAMIITFLAAAISQESAKTVVKLGLNSRHNCTADW